MTRMIFINLPVSDLPKATAFYAALGFVNEPRFTDETAACMVLSETIFVMLLTHDKWRTFTDRPIPDAGSSEVMLCISCESRDEVEKLSTLAGQNGGTATGAHYAASKGAILTLTKIFARDLAPFGVTCNAIAPGPMDTPMVRAVLGDGIEAAKKNIPVGDLGDPKFVAELVAMLAAPRAAFVNGACWDVNGGIYMR